MRLSVRKAFNFVNRNDQQSLRKYLRQIYQVRKMGHSMESLIEFFQFSTEIIKSFVLSSQLRIHL